MKIVAKSGKTYEIKQGQLYVDGHATELDYDLKQLSDNRFHILLNNRSMEAQLLDLNRAEKKVRVLVENQVHEFQLHDRYDELLAELGMDVADAGKVLELKAPMPGMVLRVLVENGATVEKGDPLLVLEAMKMENVLKAPGAATVKSIEVSAGNAVEKNEVLVRF